MRTLTMEKRAEIIRDLVSASQRTRADPSSSLPQKPVAANDTDTKSQNTKKKKKKTTKHANPSTTSQAVIPAKKRNILTEANEICSLQLQLTKKTLEHDDLKKSFDTEIAKFQSKHQAELDAKKAEMEAKKAAHSGTRRQLALTEAALEKSAQLVVDLDALCQTLNKRMATRQEEKLKNINFELQEKRKMVERELKRERKVTLFLLFVVAVAVGMMLWMYSSCSSVF